MPPFFACYFAFGKIRMHFRAIVPLGQYALMGVPMCGRRAKNCPSTTHTARRATLWDKRKRMVK